MSTVTERLRAMAGDRPPAPELIAVIDAVRLIHAPARRGRVMPCCSGCEDHPECCHEWPCPTIDAITAALGADRDGRTA